MAFLQNALGKDLTTKVSEANILVVGAGGIGCELLKNLVLSGFTRITVVDLDTIDVSNLNRQFLFRSHHVGMSKAIVAKEVALKFNPNAKIIAYHENIKTSRYSVEFFQDFSLVMNALDNVDARKHVNRLCLAAKIPLIESGTTGYLGQVSVIKKGDTECYECTEKATAKVYPICTIRSTPDKMVHCIVWAKECFKLLFGKMEESMLWEDPSNDEKSAFMDYVIIKSEDKKNYIKNIFRGLFEYEINKKLEIKIYKNAKCQPKSILLNEINFLIKNKNKNDREILTMEEWAIKFIENGAKLAANPNIGLLEFDKDDALAMEFIAAAANLRAHVFGISKESLYSCKGIAGNIIPAIATTNAIVAGLQVLEAYKILKNAGAKSIQQVCRYTYCNRSWDGRGVLLTPVSLSKPNASCFVCSRQILDLGLNLENSTLQQLVNDVLKKKMGMNEPTISIGTNTVYEEGDDAEESLQLNLVKKLTALPGGGLKNDSILNVEDFSQDFNTSLRIVDLGKEYENEEMKFLMGLELKKYLQGDDHSKEMEEDIFLDVAEKRKSDEIHLVNQKRLKQ